MPGIISRYKLKLTVLNVIVLFILPSCKKERQVEINYSTINVGDAINVQNITFIDQSLGFACGGIKEQYGQIYKTTNGGLTWQKIHNEASNCLYSISFVNDSLGFVCGENLLLLKTINGGVTWVNQRNMQGQPPSSFNSTLRTIFCVDDKNIYVAGGNGFEIGLSYKTYNGGEYWIYNTFNNELRSLYFKNKYTGYLAGYGSIIKTTDSANSFVPLPIDNDFFVSMDFPVPDIGYTCGYNGGIYKTVDGGKSWADLLKTNNDIKHNRHFNAIKFLNSTGYAVGNNGLIVFTKDGGESWSTVKKITDDNLYSLIIKNMNEVFITSSNGNIYLLKP
jgi:photosystem II stability/assembly factor-like uncharacterized protein